MRKGYSTDPSVVEHLGLERVSSIDDADVLVLPGGSDISPSLYNENESSQTSTFSSGEEEFELIKYAVRKNKYIVGICRGAQLLTAYAGGKLFQHVSKHVNDGGYHNIFFSDSIRKEPLYVPSIHHQMMNPYVLSKDDYEILGWSNNISLYYLDGDDMMIDVYDLTDDFVEPEIVWYPKIKGMAVQTHPEYMVNGKVKRDLIKIIFSKYV